MRAADRGNFFRRTAGYHAAAVCATFRPQIDDEVGALDYIKVMFDNDHRIAHAHQTLQHVEEFVHIGEM